MGERQVQNGVVLTDKLSRIVSGHLFIGYGDVSFCITCEWVLAKPIFSMVPPTALVLQHRPEQMVYRKIIKEAIRFSRFL